MTCAPVIEIAGQEVEVETAGPGVVVEVSDTEIVVEVVSAVVLVDVTPEVVVVEIGEVGPQGAPGLPGSTAPRIFDATCSAADALDDLIYIIGATGALLDVRQVDVDDPATLPARGIIVEKPTTTTAKVQVAGEVTLSGLTPGATYYAGTDSQIASTPPGAPPTGKRGIQVVGFALTATILLLEIQRPAFRIPA